MTNDEFISRILLSVRSVFDQSRELLAVALVAHGDGELAIISLDFRSEAHKERTLSALRSYCAEQKATHVAVVSEAWATSHAPGSDLSELQRPSLDPRRYEVAIVRIEGSEGVQVFSAPITGQGDNRQLGGFEEVGQSQGRMTDGLLSFQVV